MIPSPATAVSFNFTTFTQNTIADIFFQGDSFASNGVLQLTKNAVGESLRSSAGRVTSRQLIPLWDRSTGELTDFTTHFTFRIGGYLALFSPDTALNGDKGHRIVAVEFDSSRNSWDPSDDHPVDPKQELRKVRLVEWVWDLYGQGEILEAAADGGGGGGLDSEEVERLMIVGLWCCHPDEMNRPSIRQVISVLKMEAPLPSLPAKLPVPMYYAPPVDITKFKSYDTTSSGAGRTQTTTRTSSSAGSAWSGDGLLVSQKR
ncbi:L-type lectin-domain containing receptor kinase IX.1 [Linum grandiflorum]